MRNMMSASPAVGRVLSPAIWKSWENWKVPACPQRRTIPMMKPRSPAFVTQNAFIAARLPRLQGLLAVAIPPDVAGWGRVRAARGARQAAGTVEAPETPRARARL